MKIYTKTGDKGSTQVYTSDFVRVNKNDIILECYGTLDELNSHIGLLNAQISNHASMNEVMNDSGNACTSIRPEFLEGIQHTIFSIGFAISDKPQIKASDTQSLEEAIDQLQSLIPPQTKFILPGGSALAAQAHVCRTVARRAERQLVSLSLQQEEVASDSAKANTAIKEPVPASCLTYINRLSDYLFVVARVLNHLQNISDVEV